MKRFGQINVACHPHDDADTYRELFKKAKRVRTAFRKEDYAQISPISKSKKDIFIGVLAVWTEIDKGTGVLGLKDLEEIEFNKSGVVIPPDLGFNYKLFQFSFNENTHQLFVEEKNESGQTLSVNSAAKAFDAIFKKIAAKMDGIDEVNITVVPGQDTVKRIFEIKRLRSIKYRIERPNPDNNTDKFDRVSKRMEEENLGIIETKLVRAPGKETIELSDRHKEEIEVSSSNGYAVAVGIGGNGKSIKLSTKKYPKIIKHEKTETSTTSSMLREVANIYTEDDE